MKSAEVLEGLGWNSRQICLFYGQDEPDSLEDWLFLYQVSSDDRRLVIERHLAQTVRRTDTWQLVRSLAPNGSPLHCLSLVQLASQADSFKDVSRAWTWAEGMDRTSLRPIVARRMEQLAASYFEWKQLRSICDNHPELADIAARAQDKQQRLDAQHVESASTFRDWEKVWFGAKGDTALQLKAVDRMSTLARTLAEWNSLRRKVPRDSTLRPRVLEQMRQCQSSFSEWHAIWRDSPPKSEIIRMAFSRMMDLAQTTTEINNVLQNLPNGETASPQLLLRLWEAAKTFGDWLNIFNRASDHDTRRVALDRAAELAQTPAHWKEVACRAEPDSPILARALAGIDPLIQTIDDIAKLWVASPKTSPLRAHLYTRLSERPGSLVEWRELAGRTQPGSDLYRLSLEKALSFAS